MCWPSIVTKISPPDLRCFPLCRWRPWRWTPQWRYGEEAAVSQWLLPRLRTPTHHTWSQTPAAAPRWTRMTMMTMTEDRRQLACRPGFLQHGRSVREQLAALQHLQLLSPYGGDSGTQNECTKKPYFIFLMCFQGVHIWHYHPSWTVNSFAFEEENTHLEWCLGKALWSPQCWFLSVS